MSIRAFIAFIVLLVVSLALLGYGIKLGLPAKESLDISAMPWGILVPGYVFFASIAVGASIIDSIFTIYGYKGSSNTLREDIKYSTYFSLISLVPAWTLILLDLINPEHGIWLIRGFHDVSRIAWNLVLYTLLAITLLVELVYLIRRTDIDTIKNIKKAELAIAIAVLVSAIALDSNLSQAFGSLVSVPAWYGSHLVAFFLASAVLLGAAGQWLFITIVRGFKGTLRERKDYYSSLAGKMYLTILPIFWLFMFWDIVAAWYHKPTWNYYKELLWGAHAPIFWGIEVVIGLIVPVIASIVALEKRSITAAIVASIALLIAGFTSKYDLLILGQLARLHSEGFMTLIGSGFLVAHNVLHYHPATSEVLILAGAFIEWPMLLLAGILALPLGADEKPKHLYIFK